MTMPTIADWARMRRLLYGVMQDTVEIYSVTVAPNEWGQQITTRTLVTTASGQLSAAAGNEVRLVESLGAINNVDTGDQVTEVIHLVLPYGTALTTSHQVKSPDNAYWNVIQVNTSQSYTAAVEATLYRLLVNGEVIDP